MARHAAAATVAAIVGLASATALAQSNAPRTPWGDPDLQGTYTTTYEASTPLERPEEFAGRSLDDIEGEELARMRLRIQERTIG